MSDLPVPTNKLATASELANANDALRTRIGLLTQAIQLKHAERANSLVGMASNLGSIGRGALDQVASMQPLYRSVQYAPISIDWNLLNYLYCTHGILQTMIDEPVLDAFSGDDGPGFELTSREIGEGSVGKDGLGELMDFAEETGAWEALKYMLMWGALYGGSGLVINAGQDPDKPLDPRDVKRGRLEFYDADRWEFSGAYRSAPTFSFYGQTLDASRVITYGGKRAPRNERIILGGWGMSELQRAVEDFNVWLRGRSALYEAVNKANIDVYAINEYANTLALPNGEQTMVARIQATNAILNFARALIIDKEDDYKVVSKNLTGIADVMKENRIGISCATRMPYVKLWGTGAGSGGLSESAEIEMKQYHASITSRIRTPARSIIRKMLRLMMYAVFGKEYDISFTFQPLESLSATQVEEIKTSKQNRYMQLWNARMLKPQEMGDLLHKDKLIPIETALQRGELLPEPEPVPSTQEMFGEDTEGGDEDGERGDGKQPGATAREGRDASGTHAGGDADEDDSAGSPQS